MSLHDQIMKLEHGYDGACCAFTDGYGEAKKDAAQIAKEADELIGWCEAHFETLRQLADSAASFDEANIAIEKIKKYKGWTNEA